MVTFTVDPGFLWTLASLIFMAGGGWVGLQLSVRWIEKKQDLKLDAFKQLLAIEIQAVKDALDNHIERYEQEHGELRRKVEDKGESVTTMLERITQIERRLDDKLDAGLQAIGREFKAFASGLLEALKGRGYQVRGGT